VLCVVALATALALLAATGAVASASVRAAFYHPWSASEWAGGTEAVTRYHPTLGQYSSTDPAVLATQVKWMRYAALDAGISDWEGQGSATDSAVPALLAAAGTGLKWSLYHRGESGGDPSVAQLQSDLTYIATRYASSPSYLRVAGRPVVFVHSGPGDDCAMATRWKQANTRGLYIVLRAFPGFSACPNRPDSWHQYEPGVAETRLPGYSYSISPGHWSPAEATPRLARNPRGFNDSVERMARSGEPFQLITSWNDWSQGSAVESADEWVHPNCLAFDRVCTGVFLNKLRKFILSPVVTAAGDIACDPVSDPDYNGGEGTATNCRFKHTAPLLGGSQAVLALGDQSYGDSFEAAYGPTWGAFKSITHPVPGDHEYESGIGSYFSYFGAAAGNPSRGYHSFDVGAWHIIALNSNCSYVSCAVGSEQEVWLRADLAARAGTRCTLAYWHHPHFTDGPHVADEGGSTEPFWRALSEAGADVVLHGNDHNYQRWGKMDAEGDPSANGIREFVVGTGGKSHTTPTGTGAQVQEGDTFGVLKLYLHERTYDWRFLPELGKTFTDEGGDACS
jgi:hypothetical protein